MNDSGHHCAHYNDFALPDSCKGSVEEFLNQASLN